MVKEYHPIIEELVAVTEADELRPFDLSSFFSSRSLEEAFEKIDRTMEFFSVYVTVEHLEENLWEDYRYAEREEVRLCSRVEEEVRKYWCDRNSEHLKRISERVEALKNDPEYAGIKKRELENKVISGLDEEVYPVAIKRVREEYQEFYQDEWEEYWKKENPFEKRIEYRYHRRYNMPAPFNHRDSRNPWQQYYFAKDQDGIFCYAQGGSGSSGQRYNHGFYGHLFALLNGEHPVPTLFLTYNSRNQFLFEREEKTLWLNFFDLVGNFKIDWNESRKILEGVGEIKVARAFL